MFCDRLTPWEPVGTVRSAFDDILKTLQTPSRLIGLLRLVGAESDGGNRSKKKAPVSSGAWVRIPLRTFCKSIFRTEVFILELS